MAATSPRFLLVYLLTFLAVLALYSARSCAEVADGLHQVGK